MMLKYTSTMLQIGIGTGAGCGRSMGKRAEADWNTSEELWSRREADRTWLQLVRCALMHTVSYFGKPIRQKRKQGKPKLILRLEIQEETSEYIY